MDYHFKKFEGRNVRLEDRITITKSNSIGFPTRLYSEQFLKNFKYVVLFYDSEKKALALHFTNDEAEKNKFAIIHSKAGYGGSVVVRSFFNTYKLNPALYRGKYDWEKINLENVGEVFVINLKENAKEVTAIKEAASISNS